VNPATLPAYYALPSTTATPRVQRSFKFDQTRNGEWTVNDQFFDGLHPRFTVQKEQRRNLVAQRRPRLGAPHPHSLRGVPDPLRSRGPLPGQPIRRHLGRRLGLAQRLELGQRGRGLDGSEQDAERRRPAHQPGRRQDLHALPGLGRPVPDALSQHHPRRSRHDDPVRYRPDRGHQQPALRPIPRVERRSHHVQRDEKRIARGVGPAPLARVLPAGGCEVPAGPTAAGPFAPPVSGREMMRRRFFPNVVLTTHEGKQVRFYEDLLKDKIVVLNLMYANCQGVCPAITANLARAQKILIEQGKRNVCIYSLTGQARRGHPGEAQGLRGDAQRRPRLEVPDGQARRHRAPPQQAGFVDLNPRVDQNDPASHSGMVRFGNEPQAWWAACQGQANPEWIAREISFVIPEEKPAGWVGGCKAAAGEWSGDPRVAAAARRNCGTDSPSCPWRPVGARRSTRGAGDPTRDSHHGTQGAPHRIRGALHGTRGARCPTLGSHHSTLGSHHRTLRLHHGTLGFALQNPWVASQDPWVALQDPRVASCDPRVESCASAPLCYTERFERPVNGYFVLQKRCSVSHPGSPMLQERTVVLHRPSRAWRRESTLRDIPLQPRHRDPSSLEVGFLDGAVPGVGQPRSAGRRSPGSHGRGRDASGTR